VLFAAAPTSVFILAVYTARAGHRSGKIAVIVSGLLLLATLVVTFVFFVFALNGQWIGQAVAMALVVAALVLTSVLSRRIAVVVFGLLLLTGTWFLRVAQRRVDQCNRDRRDGSGRGAGFRLGALP
jgi:hypothetical protein